MSTTWETLSTAASHFGVDLTPSKVEQLQRYVRAILAESIVTNVTAVRTEEDAVERLVLDALAIGHHLRELPLPAKAVVADYGSGGGFPGVVLALVWPEWSVHLVESRGRKLEAVRRALEGLNENNIHLQPVRMEALALGQLKGRCDAITCRAVGPLKEVLHVAAPALKLSGVLIVWKSATVDEGEMKEAVARAPAERCEFLQPIPYTSFKPSQLIRFRRNS
ncbi:MAG: 16S rRNA (guanine(527)-N(7))-methyltransferase RsmG [Planctomycetes bacterium]|nr:16S rRNA (guanine(527)-N(7))-methyltransferase RsmG [Planctomycetota bacterium]